MKLQTIRLPLELWEIVIENCALLSSANEESSNAGGTSIYDEIISRRKTLLACALTCTDWVPASLRWLYHSVLLSQDEDSDHSRMALDEEGTSTHLNWLLDELKLMPAGILPLKSHILLKDALEFPSVSSQSPHVPSGLTILAALFPELGQLLTLQSFQDLVDPATSQVIQTPSVWRARLCANAIHELHLHSIFFGTLPTLIRTIKAFPSLRRLFISDIGIWDITATSAPFDDTSEPYHLKLTVFHCRLPIDLLRVILRWMVAHQVLAGKLVDLQIGNYRSWVVNDRLKQEQMELVGYTHKVMAGAVNTIRSLSIQFNFAKYVSLPRLDLKAYQSLETLVLGHLDITTAVSIITTISSLHLTTVTLKDILPRTPHELDTLVNALVMSPILSSITLDIRIDVSSIFNANPDLDDSEVQENVMRESMVYSCTKLKRAMGGRFNLQFR